MDQIKLRIGNQIQILIKEPKKHLCIRSSALRNQGIRETNAKDLSKNKCMV